MLQRRISLQETREPPDVVQPFEPLTRCRQRCASPWPSSLLSGRGVALLRGTSAACGLGCSGRVSHYVHALYIRSPNLHARGPL